MTLLYDGSQFIGVDDDAIGDGTSLATQPLDAWLQTRIQANIEYLADEPRLLCFSPVITNADDYTTVTGIRPYTQLNRGSVWRGMVIGHPGQSGIKLHVAYSSFCASGNGGQGDIEALIVVREGRRIIGKFSGTLPETETTGSPDVGVATLEASFFDPLIQSEKLMVTLSVRTVGDTDFGESTDLGDGSDGIESYSTGDGYGWLNRIASTESTTGFWNDSAAGNPDDDSLEAMYVRVTGSATSNGNYNRDLLLRSDEELGSTGTGGTYVLVFPGTDEYVMRDSAGDLAYTAYLTQSFFLRAMAYEAVIEESALDRDRKDYYGNYVVGAEECYSQHAAMRIIHRRPRLVAMGPRGIKDEQIPAYNNLNYALHWPLTFGDETGEDQVLVEDSVYLTTNAPDLLVTVQCICVQLQTDFNIATGAAAKKAANEASSKLDRYDEGDMQDGDGLGSGLAEWDITVDIDQLDDGATTADAWAGDSTSYLSETTTVALPMYPANFATGAGNGQPPVAIALDAQSYANKKEGGRAGNFWYKEGTLFADSGDLSYVATREFILETSSITQATNELPYRLKIAAALSSVPDYLRPAGSPDDDIRLTLVSYTVHEIPQDPSISATEALSNPLVTAETGTVSFGGITGEAP